MTTSKLAEITESEYNASSATVLRDEKFHEMITQKLSDGQVEINEDGKPSTEEIAYVTELVRSAVHAWTYSEATN